MSADTMRAVVYTNYGPPEVLQVTTVSKPTPKDNEVLIKIHASTVNRTDGGFRKPEYFIVRLIGGLFKPKNQILGNELAGVIESIGNKVTQFKVGDAVFGLSTYKFGTHAEYICIPETGSIAIKPQNVSFEEAAAVCDGMFLALANLKTIDFTTSPRILINGATGSIGTAAVQLAKHFGAHVTAVGNTQNLDLIRSLGADAVIDYLATDFTQCGQQFHVVFDAVGKSSFFKCKSILKPKGVYFSTELGYLSQNIWLALITPLLGGKKVKFPIPKDDQSQIEFFKTLLENGQYSAVIDRRYPIEQIVEATKYVDTGQKTGNVVITMGL